MNSPESRPAPRGANLTTSPAIDTREPVRDEHGRSAEPPAVPLGWDPFEVWRTRVRDARQDVAPRRAG